MIDQDKFGKFIAELRKEKGMTQEELAAKIYVGREAVSKWERGVGLPSHILLLSLSNEFGVSINELLYGERKTETNEEEIEVAAYKWLDLISKKLTNWRKTFIITIIAVILIYMISYFIFNYNSFKIYSTYTSSDDFTIKQGLIVRYHNKLYFKFGEMYNYNKDEIDNMALYYGDKENDKRKELISGNTLEDFMIDKKELEKNTGHKLKEVLKNLYVIILTSSGEEEYKLDVDVNFKLDLLSKQEKDELEDSKIETYSDYSNEERIRNKFKLKNGKYVYEFTYKKKKYKCTLEEDTIHFLYNDIPIRYRIGEDSITISNGTKRSEYSIVSKTCNTEDCGKYKNAINIFISNVLN